MPALQIRDCPADLYRCIRGSAERNHRSITREATALLEGCFGLEGGEDDRRRRRAAVAKLDALGALSVPDDFPDAAAIVHDEEDMRAAACLY